MALTFTPRTGVSIMHGSSLASTMRALRRLEMCDDLDLDIVVGFRAGDADESALVAGLQGRGVSLPVDAGLSDSTVRNSAIARMVDRGNQFVWIMSPELVIERWTLGVLTRHMRRVPDCAVVSPRVSARLSRAQARRGKSWDVDAVHRVGSLYRIPALETVGPFADGDEVDGHDVGWCSRARGDGWRVMVHRRARLALEGVDD